jgi:hypothetical protein
VCEDAEGNAIGEFVIKLRSSVRSGPPGLAFEFIAAHLAELLGIPIPESALVQIDSALGDSLPEGSAATATRLKNSAGLNFGLRYMTPGFNTWPVEESVPDALRQAALEIVAFDALIDNSDRNTAKPNVLWKGAELFVIDHELSFAFLFLVGGVPQAWFDRLSFLKKHPFYPGLRGRDDLDLTRFLAALSEVTDDEIDAILDAVPPQFQAEAHVDQIRAHLCSTRNDSQTFGEAILGVLR